MDEKAVCALCAEGHVTPHVREVETEYKGQKAMLPVHYQLCDTCTSDYVGAAESKLNKREVMAWRKQVDGLLTGAEITALRKQYKLTQSQAAKLFGGGPVAFSKYENDDVVQSEAMDTLLRLVRRSKEAFWALVEEKQMTAEFMREPTTVPMPSNVLHLTIHRGNTDRPDPRYSPRQFRSYSGEVKACKP
ncbi:MAG: type II toxin-antitoxin system MqsA family antitoxin [Simplicispira sp.]|nr:type II toxin-antitoxin system MqsA family antitoxin [Simplicispira sp.]